MAKPPSGVLAGAAVSAAALADLVAALAGSLLLPAATGRDASLAARAIATHLAPLIRGRLDVAALGLSLVRLVQTIARDAEPPDAAPALYAAAAAAALCVPVSASPVLTRQYRLAGALAASVQAACLGEAFLCEARTGFNDQQAAAAARARITAALEGANDAIAASLGQVAAGTLTEAAQQACAYLVDTATTLAPLVRVSLPRSYPSTALAWSLYGDPARAPELVARAQVGTPLFLPSEFIAVAPKR